MSTPDIAGKSVAAIKTSDTSLHHFYSRVENLSVPVTVLRCDFDKKSHMEYLFTIFHRLNTGGMKLNNQEIRNCIYGGPFNELLRDLDQHVMVGAALIQDAYWTELQICQAGNYASILRVCGEI